MRTTTFTAKTIDEFTKLWTSKKVIMLIETWGIHISEFDEPIYNVIKYKSGLLHVDCPLVNRNISQALIKEFQIRILNINEVMKSKYLNDCIEMKYIGNPYENKEAVVFIHKETGNVVGYMSRRRDEDLS